MDIPEIPEIRLAVTHYGEGDLERATAVLTAYIDGGGDHPFAWKMRAELRGDLGDLDGAFADRLAAAERDPTSVPTLIALAGHHSQRGEHRTALEVLERAARLDLGAERDLFHFNRGSALLELGQLEEAGAEFDRALEIQPQWPEALISRAYASRMMKRPAAAVRDLERAVALAPENAFARANLAAALHDWGDLAEALQVADQAVALEPGAFQHEIRARIHAKRGDQEGACADLEAACALAPRNAEYAALLGFALQRLERDDEALQCYQRALHIAPEGWSLGEDVTLRMEALRRGDEPTGGGPG